MADLSPDNSLAAPEKVPSGSGSGLPAAPASRRAHSYSRLTTTIAVLGLATAGYALWRLDATRDRLELTNQQVTQLESDRSVLRTELQAMSGREAQARHELEQRLNALSDAPRQLQEFSVALEELRGRAEGPERAWSRAEAAFLMELAQQRLTLDRDINTAVAALEAADLRLASLRDPGVAAVRKEISKEIQALRAVRKPDISGILARLTNAEEQAALVPVLGIVAVERESPANVLPEGFLARAWSVARNTIAGLISVRKVDDRGSTVVTVEEQALRRQHLQLQLYSARAAVVRHDAASYRSAMAGARQWLTEYFDLHDTAAAALLKELQALEPINIDPALPDISASARALQRLMPTRRATP